MPFTRPSPFEIRDRLAAEIEAALPGADARLRRSLEEVLVRMTALASHELHGHLAWAAQQILPDTAEDEILGRHAAIWGIERIPAAAAHGSVAVIGAVGAVLPAGAELRRADDARFTVDADVTLGAGGTGTAAVTALVAGAAGNAADGTVLTLVAPVAGVVAAATVAAGGLASGGIIILAEGGALPAAPLIAAVQAEIDAQRPVTAVATVYAPATQPVAVTIDLSTDTAAIRAAILDELADFFRREASPGGTLRLSRLSAAISAAAGEVSHTLSAPTADVVLPAGTIAVLGTVTWA